MLTIWRGTLLFSLHSLSPVTVLAWCTPWLSASSRSCSSSGSSALPSSPGGLLKAVCSPGGFYRALRPRGVQLPYASNPHQAGWSSMSHCTSNSHQNTPTAHHPRGMISWCHIDVLLMSFDAHTTTIGKRPSVLGRIRNPSCTPREATLSSEQSPSFSASPASPSA